MGCRVWGLGFRVQGLPDSRALGKAPRLPRTVQRAVDVSKNQVSPKRPRAPVATRESESLLKKNASGRSQGRGAMTHELKRRLFPVPLLWGGRSEPRGQCNTKLQAPRSGFVPSPPKRKMSPSAEAMPKNERGLGMPPRPAATPERSVHSF